MSELTEAEILDCMKTNFRLAAEHAEAIARFPMAGPTYNLLRQELRLIAGAARQMSTWRQDAAWLDIAWYMEEAHNWAGEWLRRHYPRPLFRKLAEYLRMGLRGAERLETRRTGIAGPRLPAPQAAPGATSGRAVQVTLPSGLIVPAEHAPA